MNLYGVLTRQLRGRGHEPHQRIHPCLQNVCVHMHCTLHIVHCICMHFIRIRKKYMYILSTDFITEYVIMMQIIQDLYILPMHILYVGTSPLSQLCMCEHGRHKANVYTYISSIIYMYNRLHVIYMVTALLCRGDGRQQFGVGGARYVHAHALQCYRHVRI